MCSKMVSVHHHLYKPHTTVSLLTLGIVCVAERKRHKYPPTENAIAVAYVCWVSAILGSRRRNASAGMVSGDGQLLHFSQKENGCRHN